MRGIIGIDIDGVIVDFDKGWTERWNDTHAMGYDMRANSPQLYDWMHRLTGSKDRSAWWEWFYERGGFRDLPVYGGAIEALTLLEDHDVLYGFISSRPIQGVEAVHDMIYSHGLRPMQVIFSRLAGNSKAEYRRTFEEFVDDNPMDLNDLSDYARVTRIERPWNVPQDYPTLERLPHVETAPSLFAYVEKLIANREETT